MTSGPPLRVGVSGHRFLAEVGRLQAAVEAALDRLEAAFPGSALQCVSPLAEGADRLVAAAVLARGGSLRVLLPLSEEEYKQDFATEASRAEFARLLTAAAEVTVLPPAPTRDESYERVGMAVLDSSDALIAIWDGQGAQGQGGTGDIVRRALDRGMPVLHIRAGNRLPGTTTPTSLGPAQGELVVHNL